MNDKDRIGAWGSQSAAAIYATPAGVSVNGTVIKENRDLNRNVQSLSFVLLTLTGASDSQKKKR